MRLSGEERQWRSINELFDRWEAEVVAQVSPRDLRLDEVDQPDSDGSSKWSRDEIIRHRVHSGQSMTSVAREFGLSRQRVGQIVRGESET